VSLKCRENGGLSNTGQFNLEQAGSFSRLRLRLSTSGDGDGPQSKGTAQPQEITALQALKQDPKRGISRRHRQLLLSMRPAVAHGDELKLSDAGQARLEAEQGNNQ
jgi:hypothetical protein